jgi:putative membrane protein
MSATALLGAALAGALVGSATGLVPGLHPNTLAVIALTLAPGEGLAFAAGLVSMGLAHQFTAMVPSSFLGAPDADDALRALPAQELLREGRAAEAVELSARGALLGAIAAMLLIAPLHVVLGAEGDGYRWLEPALPIILAAIAAILLLTETARLPWKRVLVAQPFPQAGQTAVRGPISERRNGLVRIGDAWVQDPFGILAEEGTGNTVSVHGPYRRVEARGSTALGILAALAVFTLSAGLGLVAAHVATPSLLGWGGSAMFPLLAGLFGAPPLLLALRARAAPRQQQAIPGHRPRGLTACSAAGAACGALVGLLPGMSSSAASVLALLGAPRRDREGAIVTLSAAGAGAAIITAAAYVLVGRARSGAMLVVQQVQAPQPWLGAPPPLLFALLLGCLVGAVVGYLVTLRTGRIAARVVHRVPYGALSAGVLALLFGFVLAFSGPRGIGVFAVATLVGLVPWRLGLRKGHLMGCTMGPLILGGLAA